MKTVTELAADNEALRAELEQIKSVCDLTRIQKAIDDNEALRKENAELKASIDLIQANCDLAAIQQAIDDRKALSKENAELRESLKLSYTETEKQLSRIVLALQEQVRVLREAAMEHIDALCGAGRAGSIDETALEIADRKLRQALAATAPAEGKAV